MMARRSALAALALLMLVGACSWEIVRGTASRTVRNVCANAPDCTVYQDGEAVKEDTLEPWDTKR